MRKPRSRTTAKQQATTDESAGPGTRVGCPPHRCSGATGSTEGQGAGEAGVQAALASSPGLEGHGGGSYRHLLVRLMPHPPAAPAGSSRQSLPLQFLSPLPLVNTQVTPTPDTFPLCLICRCLTQDCLALESVVSKKRLACTKSYERRVSEV